MSLSANPSETPIRKPSHIVGIGASAGGLSALEQFFANMPVDTGMAFVVIQHLSPDFKSLMDDLLARHTTMPIHRVSNGIELQPDSIYLIPPKTHMTVQEEKLYLTEKTISRHIELPIDIFFNSLAEDAGERAVGVVLSGTGHMFRFTHPYLYGHTITDFLDDAIAATRDHAGGGDKLRA